MPTYSSDIELFQVQIAKETTLGAAVTPTAKLMDVTKFDIAPEVKAEARKYLRGSLAPTYRHIQKEINAAAQMETDLSYQDFPFWLDSLLGIATPSGTNPYVYAYTGPLAAIVAARMSTLVKGDQDGTFKLTSALATKGVLKGNNTDPWTAALDFFGYDVTAGALAVLADRTTAPIMGSDTSLYLDAWGGTMGATALTGCLFDWELTIDTLRKGKRHQTLKIDGYTQPSFDVKLKLTLEYNATTHGYITSILTSTNSSLWQKQIRIKGTTGASAIAQLDFAGTADNAPKIFTDKDNIATCEFTLDAEYNSGAFANYLKASVTNGVSVLP